MKIAVRLLLVLAAVLVLPAATVASFYGAMRARFNPPAPPHDAAAAPSPLAAQRQDLAYFARLLALDRSFSPAAWREAQAQLTVLTGRRDVLPPFTLRMELARIVALADNAHTGLYADKGGRANQVPLRLARFSDGAYIVRAKAGFEDLLGARALAVDGIASERLIEALSAYRGGRPHWRRNWAVQALTSPELLAGAGFGASPTAARWTLRLRDGRTVERDLAAERPGDDDPSPVPLRWLAPQPAAREPPGWTPLLAPGAALPLALQDAEQVFRVAWIDGGCVLFLQMKANLDENGQSIADFQRRARAALKAKPACGVILDLRFNGGGDYTLAAGLARGLPSLTAPAAKIILITGVDTFSAGITTAGFVKQAGGARVVIVGEAVGDRMDFWSEGGSGCLPHARLCLHYSTGRHRYDGPCEDWRTCYWLNWLFPVRVKSLDPDVPVALSFGDYVALRDPAFERALAIVRGAGR